MIFAIVMLLTSEATSLPKISIPYQNAIRSYATCIETKMIELEPSKAGIDDIFEASKMQCAGTWNDSFEVIVGDFDKLGPSPSGRTSQDMSIEILDGVAQMSKNRTRVVILRKRAGLPPIDAQRL
jgi:hypothetical protein